VGSWGLQEERRDIRNRHLGLLGVLLVLHVWDFVSIQHDPTPFPENSTYVQPNAPNRANLLARQRRQDPVNDGCLPGRGPGIKNRAAAVDAHLDLLALAHGSADINRRIDGLAKEDLGLLALGYKSDNTYVERSMVSPVLSAKALPRHPLHGCRRIER
jgi:hypothetical protein